MSLRVWQSFFLFQSEPNLISLSLSLSLSLCPPFFPSSSIPAMLRLSPTALPFLLLLLSVLPFRPASGDMSCSVSTSASTGDYGLSTEAIDGIQFKDGQSASSLQALECTCGTDSVSMATGGWVGG